MYIYSNAFFFTINPVHQNHSHKTLQFNTHYLCLCKICRLNTSFKGPLEAFTSKVQGLFGLMTVTSVSSRLVFALAGLYICLIRVTVWSLRCLFFFLLITMYPRWVEGCMRHAFGLRTQIISAASQGKGVLVWLWARLCDWVWFSKAVRTA